MRTANGAGAVLVPLPALLAGSMGGDVIVSSTIGGAAASAVAMLVGAQIVCRTRGGEGSFSPGR